MHFILLPHAYQYKKFSSFCISNLSIPGLSDFLKLYSKLCRILADEICIKYSVKLSDLELEDIITADDMECKVAENLLNGMNMTVIQCSIASYSDHTILISHVTRPRTSITMNILNCTFSNQ